MQFKVAVLAAILFAAPGFAYPEPQGGAVMKGAFPVAKSGFITKSAIGKGKNKKGGKKNSFSEDEFLQHSLRWHKGVASECAKRYQVAALTSPSNGLKEYRKCARRFEAKHKNYVKQFESSKASSQE